MDKKKNKILIGCLALLLVMTVGYALFSENITINGTATAKGDFNMTVTCYTGIVDELKPAFSAAGWDHYVDNGYEKDSCSVVDDVVTFEADLLYPTALRNYTIHIQNTGTIAATIPIDQALIESGGTQTITYYDKDGNKLSETTTPNGSPTEMLAFTNKDGSLATDADLENFILENDSSKIKLEPGTGLYVYALLLYADGLEEDLSPEGYIEIKSTRDYNFEQIIN